LTSVFDIQNKAIAFYKLGTLMTCSSIVWNQFQNWTRITTIFRIIFRLQKIFKIHNGIRKFSKWFQVVDILLWSPRPWSKRLFVKQNHLLDILNDAIGFWLYDLAILKISESHLYYEIDFKNFCNPKTILKILIPIPFCNGFQTIEVQVIR
jgi:hypothetical protein